MRLKWKMCNAKPILVGLVILSRVLVDCVRVSDINVCMIVVVGVCGVWGESVAESVG